MLAGGFVIFTDLSNFHRKLLRDLWMFGPTHLGHQQGEFLQPVMKVVAIGQTGLDCGGAVSPAHQQPHGVVSHWWRKKHHSHVTAKRNSLDGFLLQHQVSLFLFDLYD